MLEVNPHVLMDQYIAEFTCPSQRSVKGLGDDARSTEILEKRLVRLGLLTEVFGKDVVRHLKDERQPCQ